MRAFDIIFKKRENQTLTDQEIQFLIKGYTNGEIPDYQIAAFLMAVFFRGMSFQELASLTDAMLQSGTVVDFSYLDKTPVGKHSTGGVGDKVTIALAPAVAACGVPTPKMSGRGLGHTGGTLDKLEAIPGFNVNLSIEQLKSQVKAIGCAMIGSTGQLAPADKKLYALRDVTATVESLPLIASSIMSKKLAEGLGHLLLDVKYGSGALMQDKDQAGLLAQAMVEIGKNMGKTVVARMTNMDQPMGIMVGNALEIRETLDALVGRGPADLHELLLELGAEMLLLGKAATSMEEGRRAITHVLENGKAAEKFAQVIAAQGGNAKILENPDLLPTTHKKLPLIAQMSGYLQAVDAKNLGFAVMQLGGGREKVSDSIDPRVGIEVKVKVGDAVHKGQELCLLHIGDKSADAALNRLKTVFVVGEEKCLPLNLFGPRISSEH